MYSIFYLGGLLCNWHCQPCTSCFPPSSPPYKDKEKGCPHTGDSHSCQHKHYKHTGCPEKPVRKSVRYTHRAPNVNILENIFKNSLK